MGVDGAHAEESSQFCFFFPPFFSLFLGFASLRVGASKPPHVWAFLFVFYFLANLLPLLSARGSPAHLSVGGRTWPPPGAPAAGAAAPATPFRSREPSEAAAGRLPGRAAGRAGRGAAGWMGRKGRRQPAEPGSRARWPRRPRIKC